MTRHEKARAWREKLGYSQKDLERATGYSENSIYWFERGCTPPKRNSKAGDPADREIKEWVFQRYMRACGDVDAEIRGRLPGEKFKW